MEQGNQGQTPEHFGLETGKDKAGSSDREINVHVTHLGEHEKENFKVELHATLQQIWDRAYQELKIEKAGRDVFQAPGKPNPIDLMPYLGLTLEEAQRQELCKKDFEIAAGTGGA
jgi:hypothetical protein